MADAVSRREVLRLVDEYLDRFTGSIMVLRALRESISSLPAFGGLHETVPVGGGPSAPGGDDARDDVG